MEELPNEFAEPWVKPAMVVLASIFAGLASFMYSAMLGFGVNERCTSLTGCSSASCAPCARLGTYEWVHASAQAALALIASALVAAAFRSGRRHGAPVAVGIALLWVGAVAVVATIYTDAAWWWADHPH